MLHKTHCIRDVHYFIITKQITSLLLTKSFDRFHSMKSKVRSRHQRPRKSKSPGRSFFNLLRHWEYPIVLAALVCDFNSWGHQFVYDDVHYILENTFLREPRHFLRIFTSPLIPFSGTMGRGLYRPVTALTYAVNYWISGPNPDSFHLANRLLHVITCLGIFWALQRLLSKESHIPLITTLIFAVHPIQTEAITYIVGRADALAMLFFILAWLSYIRARQSPSRQIKIYLPSVLFYSLALLSKESAITWLGVAILTEFLYFSEGKLRDFLLTFRQNFLKIYAPYFLVTILYLWAFFEIGKRSLKGRVPFLNNPLVRASTSARLLTASNVLFQSMGQLLWPRHFSVDYYYNQIPVIPNWRSAAGLGVLGLCALLLGSLFWTYRHSKTAFLGLSFFLITYSIVSNFVLLTGTIRGDRLLYMPSLGVFLFAGAAIARMEGLSNKTAPRNIVRGALALLLIALAVRTVERNRDWHDGLSLWVQTVRVSPHSATAHKALGVEYYNRGELNAALEQYRIAESIYPEYPDLFNDLGTLLLQQGKTDEAISYLRRAVNQVPRPITRHNLALALRAHGDYEEAKLQEDAIIAYYDALIKKEPSNANHHYFKGNALYSQGKLGEALAEFRLALQINPNYPEAEKGITVITQKLAKSRQ